MTALVGGTGPRIVAGIMSGTSVDGIDVAFVRLEGTGRALRWDVIHHGMTPFDESVRERVLALSHADLVRVDDLARLHVRLAHEYARAVEAAASACGMRPDAVGCHGQTVRHLPEPAPFDGLGIRATLQLGDASTLAQLLRLPVVGDFRPADVALGGQGAPLVPYVDWALLGDDRETRVALNIGGIANLTLLEPGAPASEVTAFDTGPGNMVSDALCRRFFDRAFDPDGAIAASGAVHEGLLASLRSDEYFRRPPPKSTGREQFGAAYASALAARGLAMGIEPADLVATAAALTADSIADACDRFLAARPDRLLVSGGGARNRTILDRLSKRLDPAIVADTGSVGLDPDAKEAVAFAVLAHETLGGVPTGMPRVTGAGRSAILGKICLPG